MNGGMVVIVVDAFNELVRGSVATIVVKDKFATGIVAAEGVAAELARTALARVVMVEDGEGEDGVAVAGIVSEVVRVAAGRLMGGNAPP